MRLMQIRGQSQEGPRRSDGASSPVAKRSRPHHSVLVFPGECHGALGASRLLKALLELLAKTEEGCSGFQEWERGPLGTSA